MEQNGGGSEVGSAAQRSATSTLGPHLKCSPYLVPALPVLPCAGSLRDMEAEKQSFAVRLERATAVPKAERSPDVAAFVESVQLLRDVAQMLPLDRQGRPTLKDPAVARQQLLLGAAKVSRARYLTPHLPVADCEWEEALQIYMAVFASPWKAAATKWSSGGGGVATGGSASDDDHTELGAVLFLFTTGRGPELYAAACRSAQAAAMLAEPGCHAAVGQQLAALVASQPKRRSGGRPPLLTAQQLQAACCRHAVEVVYAAATLQRRPNLRPEGFTPLSAQQLGEALAGQERCAEELLRLEPEVAQSHAVAALALRSRQQESTADAELADRYLCAFRLARQSGSDFLLVKGAADSLGAAFLHCSRRGAGQVHGGAA